MNPFERLRAPETPSSPEPAGAVPAEPSHEQRAESREQIIERAQEGRRNLLKGAFTSRTADLIGNFLPGVDVPKMLGEAIAGKTVSGEELSHRKRFDHVAISGAIALAYGLELAGMPAEAIAARTIASFFAKIEFGPEVLAEAAHMTADRFPKASHLLEQTAAFVGHKRDLLTKAATEMRAALERFAPHAAAL